MPAPSERRRQVAAIVQEAHHVIGRAGHVLYVMAFGVSHCWPLHWRPYKSVREREHDEDDAVHVNANCMHSKFDHDIDKDAFGGGGGGA